LADQPFVFEEPLPCESLRVTSSVSTASPQAPGGPDEDRSGDFAHGGWSVPFFDPEIMGPVIGEIAQRSEALLQGRRTYQSPRPPGRSVVTPSDWVNATPKYVVSDTLEESDITWQPTTIIRGSELLDTVGALRAAPGGDIDVYGSLTLVRSLLAADLLDELVVMIEPITLGGGKSLFPADGDARSFELISSTTSTTGVVICRYRPL
jgi:dihydrofolate reductase